jgi:hypothetical protein
MVGGSYRPFSLTRILPPFLVQLAALDLIVSSAGDLFAVTDPGSQLSSLVTGMRMYHGRGKLPTIRPDKRQLAAALVEHKDIEWHVFVNRVSIELIHSFLAELREWFGPDCRNGLAVALVEPEVITGHVFVDRGSGSLFTFSGEQEVGLGNLFLVNAAG